MGVELYQGRWAYGRCVGLSKEESDRIFFVGAGRPKKVPEHEEFCSTCPIRNFCLSYAIVHEEEGVWGGMTKNQRDHLGADVKLRLTEEAVLQGWFEHRLSIDSLIQKLRSSVPEIQTPDFEEEFLEIALEESVPESVFDFVLEYTLQTPQEPYMPPVQSLGDVQPLDSDNGPCEDSSESLFGLPSPSLDSYRNNKQLLNS